jgi:diguanylate cyclase (GGDEF)-like protein
MALTSTLLAKKQARYLYQSLNLAVVSLFLAVSMVLYLLWDLPNTREMALYWYIANLLVLALRMLIGRFYWSSSTKDNPYKWIILFATAVCLNGTVLSLVIFIVPSEHSFYYTYILLLLGTIAIASIASLGIIKRVFFPYLGFLAAPLMVFFINNNNELHAFHVYGYIVIFLFTSSAVIRINKSLISAFTMEIENEILRKKLTKETSSRLHAEDKMRNKAQELQILNDTLETKVKEKTVELENLAFYDTLTQLPNRHHFYDYLERTLERNQLKQDPFALFFIDLDEFKTVTDTLAHDFGDILLTPVAQRLRKIMRVDDFVARISGDEFIIIVKKVLHRSKFMQIADNIVKKISEPYLLVDTQTFISCSLGIVLYPEDGDNTNTLIKHSDLAMYYAKENGKNSFYFFNTDLYEKKAQKFILKNALQTAIQNNELFLVYQPKVSCKDASISSMEVLLRWNSPQFGFVPPDEFIALAEESNQILELEEFVLITALTQVKQWNKNLHKNLCVAVNISGIHFMQKNFVPQIEDILSKLEFNPQNLELELTESALMSDSWESIEKLARLKSKGIKLSIDDFGTGYSSLSYLKQLPIDNLKIDKSFIDGIPDDKNNTAITKVIIDLAHQFNLQTIAEGVEHKHQLDFLQAAGCTFIQGYYYHKPLSIEAFEKVIRADHS